MSTMPLLINAGFGDCAVVQRHRAIGAHCVFLPTYQLPSSFTLFLSLLNHRL